jgi:hypothetical protein
VKKKFFLYNKIVENFRQKFFEKLALGEYFDPKTIRNIPEILA